MDELQAEGEGNFLFLSPKKVQRARDLKAEREQAKINEELAKEERKLQAAINKERKKLEDKERKLRRLQLQAERATARARKEQLQQEKKDDAALLVRQGEIVVDVLLDDFDFRIEGCP